MGRLGRDIYRRKLARLISQSLDEDMVSLISAVVAVQSGNQNALHAVRDLPPEAVGAELGSPYHIPLWSLETLVNELLATPKPKGFYEGRTRLLNSKLFRTLQILHSILVHLEDIENGIFLESHDVFYEMARIVQRQFPWQRGVLNAPHFYRSILLYGTGTAREYFEANVGTSLPAFVKSATYLYAALSKNDFIDRSRDLSTIGVTPAMFEAALARIAIPHVSARSLTVQMRRGKRQTAYSPSILRDFPILAFGDHGERLRAPIPDLVVHRYTSGLYLDVVQGGPSVWTDIGRRFETYVLEYLQAMLEPYLVTGEKEYGPKKKRHRTPDILVASDTGIVAAIECKAKRMSFDARFADDPVASASLGFDELAKGMFQLWRFFSHARRGLTGDLSVDVMCQGVIVTADSWLTMAAKQAEKVVATAHILADAEGGIEDVDRRDIAFCQIDDVEYSLQNGTAKSFLAACREIASGRKKWFMLSVAHSANRDIPREYPFEHRIPELLPWLDDPSGLSR
jgi:hypothetical protein